ncbi:MAG: outer membrane protein assembly factor BamD [Candidatus Chromulinivorax sp.]|nr:outer membrane protein assembly factor BamD [Candidatus Chromulinivorax sp.]
MNNKKYLLYLVFIGIFCTFCNHSIANSSSIQESTVTENTLPQKKDNIEEFSSETASTIEEAVTPENNSQISPDTTQTLPKADLSEKIEACPHAGVPAELLTTTELEEVLSCAQAHKEKLDQQIEKLEEIIEKSASEEQTNPAVVVEKTKQHKKYLLNYITDAPRCPYSSTPLKKLKAPQLEEVYAYTQTHKMDGAFMVDLLERLIALSDNHAGVKQYKLQLADKHYELHHIEKAAACYEDFGVMYPGSDEAEYVLYKAVVCMFELALDADRDQTNTKKTIVLIKEFLKRAKKQELIDEANSILQKCQNRLYDHEVYVFNFYTKKKNFVAAQMRLDYIAKSFTETIVDLDKKVADLADVLALRKNPVKPTKKSLVQKFIA